MVGLEVEAELSWQAGGGELGGGRGQAEVLEDLAHDDELGDVGDHGEGGAAARAVEGALEGSGDELRPGDAPAGRSWGRRAEAGNGLRLKRIVGAAPRCGVEGVGPGRGGGSWLFRSGGATAMRAAATRGRGADLEAPRGGGGEDAVVDGAVLVGPGQGRGEAVEELLRLEDESALLPGRGASELIADAAVGQE